MALTHAMFDALIDQHGHVLYRIAYRLSGDRHEAEDLVQETYRSAWRSRARYKEGMGERAWLASIMRRRSVDRWRKKRLPTVLAGEAMLEVGIEDEDPTASEYSDEMQWALEQLPVVLREALLLVIVGELTHQEVADLLDVPLGTILSRVSRARKQLRTILVAATKSA